MKSAEKKDRSLIAGYAGIEAYMQPSENISLYLLSQKIIKIWFNYLFKFFRKF